MFKLTINEATTKNYVGFTGILALNGEIFNCETNLAVMSLDFSQFKVSGIHSENKEKAIASAYKKFNSEALSELIYEKIKENYPFE